MKHGIIAAGARRQKIVFFTTGMTTGGAERVIATLANALAVRGLDVVIAMLKGHQSAYKIASGVKLCSADLAPGLKNFPRAIGFYRRVVAREAPDAIISFSTKSDIVALLSRILFRTPGRLVVSDRADPYTRDFRMQFICNALYRASDAIVCQSQAVADYYRQVCAKFNISVIPNPLDENAIGKRHAVRAPIVIAVGRLADQKDHRLAIAVFKRIHDKLPAFSMKIFGEGPLEAGLREQITSSDLEGAVTLEGVVSDVIRAQENAALFLFTSHAEGYPNALMEAAATGIPCVTTDFSPGTAREIIADGVNGYIVPVRDEEAIATASLRILAGELDSREFDAASDRVRERHRLEPIIEAWLAAIWPQ